MELGSLLCNDRIEECKRVNDAGQRTSYNYFDSVLTDPRVKNVALSRSRVINPIYK